ncbi:MAG: hypothetical protein GY812_13535 [Actinomycetia bacterium]|nr:hypothetical protein [Actinomycetes bacterium]
MTEHQTILYEVDGAVATVTLNRPEQMNAITWRMLRELEDAFARADGDDSVRAVVLTGAGKAFCAGADLEGGADTFGGSGGGSGGDSGGEPSAAPPGLEPWQCRKPVIAAINGHAIGGGLTYPLMCDIRIVAQEAKLGFVFVRRGLIPELGSHAILPSVIGLSNAADLMFSGRTIRGAEAAEIGLASSALPAHEVLPAALDKARDIAEHAAPAAVALSKELLWSRLGVAEMQKAEEKRFFWAAKQPDAVEGVMSFVEKRRPEWKLGAGDVPDFDDATEDR